MAISAREMTIILKAQNEMSREIERIEQELEGMKGASTEAKDRVDDLARALEEAGGAGEVIKQLAGELKALGEEILKYAEAYGEAEQAERRLEIAARQNPYMNKQSAENLKDYASQLKQISIYDDDQITQQAAILAAMGLTEKQIKNVLKASVDLASSGMMSLEQATKSLGETYSGTVGTLGRSIPLITGLTEAELKAGKAIDIVAGSFSGLAEEMTRTTTGAIAVAERGWGDFGETIGKIITQVPLLTEVTVGFVNMVKTIEPLATSAAAIWLMRDAIQGLGVALSTKLLPSLVAIATNPVFLAIAAGTFVVGAVAGAIDSSYTNKLNTDSAFREKEILNDLITLQNEKNMLDESEEVVTARIASNYGVNLDVLREIARTHNINLESLKQQKDVAGSTVYQTPIISGKSGVSSAYQPPVSPMLEKEAFTLFDGMTDYWNIVDTFKDEVKKLEATMNTLKETGATKTIEILFPQGLEEAKSDLYQAAVRQLFSSGFNPAQSMKKPGGGMQPSFINEYSQYNISDAKREALGIFEEVEKIKEQTAELLLQAKSRVEQLKEEKRIAIEEATRKETAAKEYGKDNTGLKDAVTQYYDDLIKAETEAEAKRTKEETAQYISTMKNSMAQLTKSSLEYLKYQKEQELAEAKKYGDEATKLATEYWDKRIEAERNKQRDLQATEIASLQKNLSKYPAGNTFHDIPVDETNASKNPYVSWMKDAYSQQKTEGFDFENWATWLSDRATKEWLPKTGDWLAKGWEDWVIGGETKQVPKEIGSATVYENVTKGGWDVSKEVGGVVNAIVGGGGAVGGAIGDFSQVTGLSAVFGALGGAVTGVVGALLPMLGSLKSVTAVLNPLQTIAKAIFDVLGPSIDTALKPVVGLLAAIGKVVGKALLPVIESLIPIIEGLTNFLVWVWNNILRPVFNGLLFIFVSAYNVIMEVLDGISFWDDTFQEKDYAVYKPAGEIVMTKAEADATGGTSVYGSADEYYHGLEGGSSGGGPSPAQYTEGRTINVLINYQDAVYIAGGKQGLDELAELIKAKIIEVEALGL